MKSYRYHRYFFPSIIAYLLTFTHLAIAEEDTIDFPVRCKTIQVDTEITLQTKSTSPQLYLINNISRYLVTLVGINPSAITEASQIASNQWSALTISDKQVSFICIEQSRRGSEQRVPCSIAVKMCAYDNISFANKKTVNQWVVENETLPSLLENVEKSGIILPQ